MRKTALVAIAILMVAAAIPAIAELQTVTVGGEITIRGNYYMNVWESPQVDPDWPTRAIATGEAPNTYSMKWLGLDLMINRPILGGLLGLPTKLNGRLGAGLLANQPGIMSRYAWSSDTNDLDFIEQRTRLNVKADFTDEVSALIELDSYDLWGDEDFRSNWVTGVDSRAATADDVEVYQAYIEANEMWGMPLRARIGRQEISLGSEWLVGVNDAGSQFTGLSFDALRLTYATDMFSVDAIAAKLSESGVAEEDGDAWLYGLYGSYLGLENITIDAYWLWLRDPTSLGGPGYRPALEWLESLRNLDDYDVTNLHTVGLRGAGTVGDFDFEAEAAYQFGDADQTGAWFGEDGAEYSAWAANLEVGYTIDMAWQPRVFLGGAYFDGEDNRDVTAKDLWIQLWNTAHFRRFRAWVPDASISFNRLFSNWEYSQFLDFTDLSNAYVLRGGVTAMPTESIETSLTVAYLGSVEQFDSPAYWTWDRWVLDGYRRFVRPLARRHYRMTEENDDELGWEVGLCGTYHYTEDLAISAGWSHLFVGDGLEVGNFNNWNGLMYNGGRDSDDADYLWFETQLSF